MYNDWYRASINLQIERFDDEYIDAASSSICPKCKFKVQHGVLVVREDGVWEIGGSDAVNARSQRNSIKGLNTESRSMKAVLIRVGIDHSFGHWNAPADPESREFVYVPIPENDTKLKFHESGGRLYDEVIPSLKKFVERFGYDLQRDLRFPSENLLQGPMHLDPDFSHLTYGNKANRKSSIFRKLVEGDLLVFYAGMRSMRPKDRSLIYGIIGLFVVDEWCDVRDIPRSLWHQNAHTRKVKRGKDDVVFWGKRGVSGRLSRFIPIGELRDRAYRVRSDLLKTWGDLSVKDGYIQRSAQPPTFRNPERFYKWFLKHNLSLMEANFDEQKANKVIIVQLRQPKRDPSERRDDPFYEFGSFGCTGCHGRNLMSPKRIHELEGVRVAFAQGGPSGTKLVLLTPPVQTTHHAHVCELRWKPIPKPFRYDCAPLLIDNQGETHFPPLKQKIESVHRTTWMGKFSSSFRTSRTPLPEIVARSLVDEYERLRREASESYFAKSHLDTLPFPPGHAKTQRRKRYQSFLTKN